MNILLEKHRQILFDLMEAKVSFLLVGGYAVIYHGYGRITGDMDIWIKPDSENKLKLITVLEKQNISKEGIDKIRKTDFTEVVVFHIGKQPEKIEFLTRIAGLKFEDAFKAHSSFQILNHKVPILHLNDLIANKLLTARPKDLADVDELQKIHKLKKK